MEIPSSAPHQMQVRVTFYTSHNPQSVLMILKNDQSLDQITEKARELFPSADYRLYYGDVNGPIYEFTDSEQVMSKIRITTFSRTPQLFVRLESGSTLSSSAKKASKAESKSSASLKRIEQNQELALKNIEKLQKEMERVSALETIVANIHSKETAVPVVEKINRPLPPVKHSASCDACLGDIVGHRYKCLECADYDLCEKCEKKSVHYEHAMIRLVHPIKTKIPAYVANSSPNNVFPNYMRTQPVPRITSFYPVLDQLEIKTNVRSTGTPVSPPVPAHVQEQMPAPAPAPAPVTGPEARFFNEETCAALINSASVLKETFSTLSKSFMDLADGAQANMDKKIIDRSTMEAGVKKVEEKVDSLKRHCEEKCFGAHASDPEKTEKVSKKHSESSSGPKIKKAKSKSVYKKTSEKLVAMTLAAAAEEQSKSREEAKKRADASTAELQRKLAELNVKPTGEEVPFETTNENPTSNQSYTSSLDALMRAILNTPTINPPTTPNVEPTTPATPAEATRPVASVPARVTTPPPAPVIYPGTVTRIPWQISFDPRLISEYHYNQLHPEEITSAPVQFESIVADPVVESVVLPPAANVVPQPEQAVSVPTSIHSSFENISSDFESLSPSWGYQDTQRQDNIDEDLLDFADVAEAPEEVEAPRSEPGPSLPRLDSETEKTFDRLLEMGFDYNVVVSAIRENGSDLEKCLLSLIH